MEIENILKEKAEDFRKVWNKGSHDWISTEGMLFIPELKLLFVSFCREYCVHSDENAYSMVYVFSERKPEGERIYYHKFYDACPYYRDPQLFIRALESFEIKDDKVVISAKDEDGVLVVISHFVGK